MSEQMHPKYTSIPKRSVDALVRDGEYLVYLLMALSADPDEVADLIEQRDPYDVRLYTFEERGISHVEAALQTVCQWYQSRDSDLGEIFYWEPKVVMWCWVNMVISFREAVALSMSPFLERAIYGFRDMLKDRNSDFPCDAEAETIVNEIASASYAIYRDEEGWLAQSYNSAMRSFRSRNYSHMEAAIGSIGMASAVEYGLEYGSGQFWETCESVKTGLLSSVPKYVMSFPR